MKQKALVLSLTLFASLSIHASEIPGAMAEAAVKGWLRNPDNPAFEPNLAGKSIARTVTHCDASGHVLFDAVEFEGGGFVITSPNDALEPILAFSDSGSLAMDDRNPLWAMLQKEMNVRAPAARLTESSPRPLRARYPHPKQGTLGRPPFRKQ